MTFQTRSQTHDVAFGLVQSFSAPASSDRCIVVGTEESGQRRLFLWSPGSQQLASVDLPLMEQEQAYHSYTFAHPVDDVLSDDFNGDGLPDLLLVQKTTKQLVFVYDLTKDSLRASLTLPLQFEPSNVVVGDINNDKRPDLLILDRANQGIIPFLGQAGGSFREAPAIAPDNAVLGLSRVFLNNDFIPDLVFYDWVKSDLHFSYGVGRGKFLDLTTLAVEGQVNALTVLPLATGRFMDIVLQLPKEFQVWEGDVTGDFRKIAVLPVQHSILSYDIADIDHDGKQDIAFLDENGMLNVMLAPLEGEASTVLDFYVGKDASRVLLADYTGDGLVDALILRSKNKQILLYRNAEAVRTLSDSLQYAAGNEPRGIWVGDLNADEQNDLVLVNGGSNSLSIYRGNETGGLHGQTSIQLPVGPRQLAYHSSTDSTVNFIVTYPSTQSISYLSIHREDFSTVNSLIPEVGELELLYSNVTSNGLAEFFCYNVAREARAPSLIFYQQIAEKTFIERTFRLSIPDLLLGAAVGEINQDGLVDIAFAYRNNESNRNELVLSLGDSSMSFTNKFQVMPLPEGAPRRSYMWMKDFDSNDTLELLLVFPQTLKQMLLAKGTQTRNFEILQKMPEQVELTDRSQLQVLDLNGDGVLDLAVHNKAKNELGWYRGIKGGVFAEWQPLVSATDISHFAFGDLNHDHILDLAVTLSGVGIVKVYDGRIVFQQSGGRVDR